MLIGTDPSAAGGTCLSMRLLQSKTKSDDQRLEEFSTVDSLLIVLLRVNLSSFIPNHYSQSSLLLYCAATLRLGRHFKTVSLALIMFFPVVQFFILAAFSLLTNTCAVGIVHRESCAENYTPCSPPGAITGAVPTVGDALSGLYFDLVSSVNPQPVIRDLAPDPASDQIRDVPSTVCCESRHVMCDLGGR
jgi:hypothetical protein